MENSKSMIVRFKDNLDIICGLRNNLDGTVEVSTPMMFELRGQKLVLEHWLPLQVMKGNSVRVPIENILCTMEPSDDLAEYFEKTVSKLSDFVEETDNNSEEENMELMEALMELETNKGVSIH
jgi:hypothetical protein